jgi:hypothetical protein
MPLPGVLVILLCLLLLQPATHLQHLLQLSYHCRQQYQQQHLLERLLWLLLLLLSLLLLLLLLLCLLL